MIASPTFSRVFFVASAINLASSYGSFLPSLTFLINSKIPGVPAAKPALSSLKLPVASILLKPAISSPDIPNATAMSCNFIVLSRSAFILSACASNSLSPVACALSRNAASLSCNIASLVLMAKSARATSCFFLISSTSIPVKAESSNKLFVYSKLALRSEPSCNERLSISCPERTCNLI